MQYPGTAQHHVQCHTLLHVVAADTMTGLRYIDEVIPHLRLFHGPVGNIFVCMDDNTPYHRTLIVQECIDSEVSQHIAWPERSGD
ncbi:hypothetical protein AVEN_175694-1 [Araneus ventricosus]|nr:hypothetical protein AVEN_175694-1 [Araneus ventricosus]